MCGFMTSGAFRLYCAMCESLFQDFAVFPPWAMVATIATTKSDAFPCLSKVIHGSKGHLKKGISVLMNLMTSLLELLP